MRRGAKVAGAHTVSYSALTGVGHRRTLRLHRLEEGRRRRAPQPRPSSAEGRVLRGALRRVGAGIAVSTSSSVHCRGAAADWVDLRSEVLAAVTQSPCSRARGRGLARRARDHAYRRAVHAAHPPQPRGAADLAATAPSSPRSTATSAGTTRPARPTRSGRCSSTARRRRRRSPRGASLAATPGRPAASMTSAPRSTAATASRPSAGSCRLARTHDGCRGRGSSHRDAEPDMPGTGIRSPHVAPVALGAMRHSPPPTPQCPERTDPAPWTSSASSSGPSNGSSS